MERCFDKDINFNQEELIYIKTAKGKVYLTNRTYSSSVQIPLEDKVYIEKMNIENNLINIFGYSPISL